jgi:serine/threonine protein kinase
MKTGMEEEKRNTQKMLGGRYRVLQRLSSRPRLTLYLACRSSSYTTEPLSLVEQRPEERYGPFFAIRELVLSDFPPVLRAQVEAASLEEFASSTLFSLSSRASAGDRLWCEHECLYLALQLDSSPTSSKHLSLPVTLDGLLLDTIGWPHWLNVPRVLEWGIALCRMVARLHHQGVVLGNINPCTILVLTHEDKHRISVGANYTPLLLPCWPPALYYWNGGKRADNKSLTSQMFAAYDYDRAFPLGRSEREDTFAAPEMLYESRAEANECADIYSLGAILYLLLTHYAPTSAACRLQYARDSDVMHTRRDDFLPLPITPSFATPLPATRTSGTRFERRRQQHQRRLLKDPYSIYDDYEQTLDEQGLDLPDPRQFNTHIPPQLADIVMQALELEPDKRFASAFALVEALEEIEL